MAGMVSNTREPGDDLRDARERPEIRRELVLSRARTERLVDLHQVGGVQSWLATCSPSRLQAGTALLLPRVEPVVGADPRDS
jgi:hypothetical protein